MERYTQVIDAWFKGLVDYLKSLYFSRFQAKIENTKICVGRWKFV